jgi:hypothetical protein
LERLSSIKRGLFTFTATGQRNVGVEAQSVLPVMPEIVHEGENGFLSVSYGNAALVIALELANELLALKKTVQTLRG